jgi:hypothetical protein
MTANSFVGTVRADSFGIDEGRPKRNMAADQELRKRIAFIAVIKDTDDYGHAAFA